MIKRLRIDANSLHNNIVGVYGVVGSWHNVDVHRYATYDQLEHQKKQRIKQLQELFSVKESKD